MKHGSLCTGIGGFDLAFERAGFELTWQVEIEPFCSAVLATHWPNVRRFTDVREVGKHNLEAVDVLTAGFPCQDLSVAGKRAGLAGDKSGLFFDIARVIGELTPRWIVLENVPGLLSSKSGRDFAIVLSTLAEIGYGLGYRILDSQFFGVAQRRRRVFIVGCFGKQCPTEILFEPESGGGDIAKSKETATSVTSQVEKGVDSDCTTTLAFTLRESDGHHGRSSPRGDGCDNLVAATLVNPGRQWNSRQNEPNLLHAAKGPSEQQIVATLNSGGNSGGFRTEPGEHLVAFNWQEDRCFKADERTTNPLRVQQTEAVAFHESEVNPDREKALTSQGLKHIMSVRRITPVECERLQGFPDGFTIPAEGQYGNGKKTRSNKALQVLHKEDATGSGKRRRSTKSASFSQKEILQSDLLGKMGVRQAEEKECSSASRTLSGQDSKAIDTMRTMRFNEEHRQAPQGRKPVEQQIKQHRESLSPLSYETPRFTEQRRKSECSDTRNSESQEVNLLPKGQDSARYRALGNAVTVSTVHWIAKRIAKFEGQ